MLTTRRIGSDDPRLHALHSITFPLDSEPDWEYAAWWAVYEQGTPVAFAGLQPSQRWRDAGYLVRAGVLPAHRGRGLQRRLLRARERFARDAGWRWLLSATYKNTTSANNLIREGFLLYEPRRPWLARGALYWLKELK